MLPEWAGLLRPLHAVARWQRPSEEACIAAVIVILIFAAAGAGGGWFVRKLGYRSSRLVFAASALISCVLLLNSFRVLTGFGAPHAEVWIAKHGLTSTLLLIGVCISLIFWRRAGIQFYARTLMVLAPFLFVTIGQALFVAFTTDFQSLERTPERVALRGELSGRRVIVVVFDELDYGLAFSNRPSTVKLDAFDSLRSRGFFATDVRPASYIGTALAIPSLLTGTQIDAIVRMTPASVIVRLSGSSRELDLAEMSTLFDDAAALGVQSELVGAYLPYCRWRLASFTNRCTWWPNGIDALNGKIPLGLAIKRQLFALGGPISTRTAKIHAFEYLSELSIHACGNPANRLVFLHLMVPHQPYIWDAKSSEFSRLLFRQSRYFDNLELADRVLARLRQSVTDAGLRDQTTFVVLSDHGYRGGAINGTLPDRHVPFAVTLPADSLVVWSKPVNVVPLRRLVGALLRNEVRTAEELAHWMDRKD